MSTRPDIVPVAQSVHRTDAKPIRRTMKLRSLRDRLPVVAAASKSEIRIERVSAAAHRLLDGER